MERRTGAQPDTGKRRRGDDPAADFALFRDYVLLGLGAFIVVTVGIVALFWEIKTPAVAMGALTAAVTLLGAPGLLRIDEARRKGRDS